MEIFTSTETIVCSVYIVKNVYISTMAKDFDQNCWENVLKIHFC